MLVMVMKKQNSLGTAQSRKGEIMIDITANMTVNGVSYIKDNNIKKEAQILQATITPDGGMTITKDYIDREVYTANKNLLDEDADIFEEKANALVDKLLSELD